jgi:serine/threonine protein kinase
MSRVIIILFFIVATVIGAAAIGVLLRHILGPVIRGVIHVIQFIGLVIIELIRDIVAACVHIIVSIVIFPIIIGMLALGRWESAARMASGIRERFRRVGRRVGGLVTKTDFASMPKSRTTRPKGKPGEFPGWRVVGELQAGGSGAMLHVAEPTHEAPLGAPSRVVIKCFDTTGGAPLGHMIRESRALEGAKKLGLIVEHNNDEHRFWYVMPFIPGTHLAKTVASIHTDGVPLSRGDVSSMLGWQRDLLAVLGTYHDAGLWHKDVKPENIITNDTGAHLVDFGLVTPLQSAMTLTTHGTEYFRDPELVRQALRGTKVSEVDGARFDIYSAGAVLYYMVEGTFPAHGNLSRFNKEEGDAIRWVIRRAMSDYHQRYESITVILADVAFLAQATDPRLVRPADLPSFGGDTKTDSIDSTALTPECSVGITRRRPQIDVTDWWSGTYRVRDAVPGTRTPLPDAFSAAHQAREAALEKRAARRTVRRANRKASLVGIAAFCVGFVVLVGGFIVIAPIGAQSKNSHVGATQTHQSLPQGQGKVLIVSDHARRPGARDWVAAQLQKGGWEYTSDVDIEAAFRKGLPINGTASADFPHVAQLLMKVHGLDATVVITAPEDDPNGVEAVFVTPNAMDVYRFPGLSTEASDVQSSP